MRKICKFCGKEFIARKEHKNYKQKFCSQICSNRFNAPKLSKARMGKNNPRYGKKPWNYIDGKRRGRETDMKYWIWRRKVLKRDNYICQKCNKKFSRHKLVAHHIKEWINYSDLRYSVNNGQTLCRPCHNKIDHRISDNLKLAKKLNRDKSGQFMKKEVVPAMRIFSSPWHC